MKRFKFVFDVESISGLQMLALVEELLNKFSSPAVFFLHGVKIDIKALEKKILKKNHGLVAWCLVGLSSDSGCFQHWVIAFWY